MIKNPILTRGDLLAALDEAAAIEHAVSCQYLFAAHSLKAVAADGPMSGHQWESIRKWKAALLLVARQEMEHMGIVANIVNAVGGRPGFSPPTFPAAASYCPPLTRHSLERFSDATLEELCHVERAHEPSPKTGRKESEPNIGDLFSRIKDGLVHLSAKNESLFVGSTRLQVSNATLDLPPGRYDIELAPVVDLATATAAIDRVVEEGSDASGSVVSHLQRIMEVRRGLGEELERDSGFRPAREVVSNPRLHHPSDQQYGVTTTVIEHPISRNTVALYNHSYNVMLVMLDRFYSHAGTDAPHRSALMKLAFFPFMTMVLRPLGDVLTLMPALGDNDPRRAAPTFETAETIRLPYDPTGAWTVLHEHLEAVASESTEVCSMIAASSASWTRHVATRLAFVNENLRAIAHNFARYVNLEDLRVRHMLRRVL